jgi:AmmeMemoRadiSam system protein B
MIRKAQYAGSWYPADPHSLRNLVEKSIAEVEHHDGMYRFAVLPHAGLFYSKAGIAPFFAADFSTVQRIAILAPSHYANLSPNMVVSAPVGGCETPLGMLECTNFSWAQNQYFSAVQSEHALEMVLPYIAVLDPAPTVSLALVSSFSEPAHVKAAAKRVLEELGEEEIRTGRTVVVASSDFTHYGPRFGYTPYPGGAHQRVKEDDLALSTLLCEGRIEEAFAFCAARGFTVCGCAASMVVAYLAHHFGITGRIADYYTSNDVSGSVDANFVAYSTILWS